MSCTSATCFYFVIQYKPHQELWREDSPEALEINRRVPVQVLQSRKGWAAEL